MDSENNEQPTEEQQTETPEAAEQEQEQPEQPEETEAKADDAEAEEGSEEEATDPGETKTAEQKHKRKGGWQRRVERLEQEREILLRQLAAGQQPQQPQAPTTPAKEQTPEEKAASFIQSMVQQSIAAERDRERQDQEQKRQAAAIAESRQKAEAFRAQHDDFDDVLASAQHTFHPLAQQALLTSPESARIMYSLAKSPAELARISALPPLEAIREIGRLEAKASSTPTPKTPKSAARPPAPPTNVGGSSASTRNLDDLPFSEWKKALRSKGR